MNRINIIKSLVINDIMSDSDKVAIIKIILEVEDPDALFRELITYLGISLEIISRFCELPDFFDDWSQVLEIIEKLI